MTSDTEAMCGRKKDFQERPISQRLISIRGLFCNCATVARVIYEFWMVRLLSDWWLPSTNGFKYQRDAIIDGLNIPKEIGSNYREQLAEKIF